MLGTPAIICMLGTPALLHTPSPPSPLGPASRLSLQVLTLGEAAFSGAFMLTSVWIPNGTQIEIDTFDGCGCDGALFKPGAILCDCKAAARWPCDDAPPPSL